MVIAKQQRRQPSGGRPQRRLLARHGMAPSFAAAVQNAGAGRAQRAEVPLPLVPLLSATAARSGGGKNARR